MFSPSLSELAALECWSLLETVPIGRVGISVKALPVVLPVNFAVVDRCIVFRTVEGTKLKTATAGAVVAFEADAYETDGRSGWSVLIQGVAGVVHDPVELATLARLPIEAWALDGAADRYVQIQPTTISGRRFRR